MTPEQSHPPGSVFLSYASQDAGAAARICEALQAVGVPVWLDKSALRGGDAWDAQIKKQIHDCALFVPLISAHTNARAEGYFHREWNLATRRVLDMAHDAAFLIPVVVDDTREADAHVPEEFLRAQWTWLPSGETPPAFAHRVRQLLGGDLAPAHSSQSGDVGSIGPSIRSAPSGGRKSWFSGYRGRRRLRNLGFALIALLIVLGAGAFWYFRGANETPTVAFAPPPHSVAVLAFANMSGDPKDEYFSDGLSEELLNTLVRIDELQVAARTSSFSFKGAAVDIPTVGRKLNVGAVLEGSVRRAGERVRITTQLFNTVTGFNMWSQTFDRELKDILALQSEIATDVASALHVVLLAGEKKQLTDGSTNSPRAFDAYLRGRQMDRDNEEGKLRGAVDLYDEAIRLDPTYALAYAYRASALSALANYWVGTRPEEKRELEVLARASAEKAVELAPNSGQVYAMLSVVLSSIRVDVAAVESVMRRGLAVEPGNYDLQSLYSRLAVDLERPDAIDAARRAVTLNPLDANTHGGLGIVLLYSRQYDEAREAFDTALRLRDSNTGRAWRGTLEIAAKRPAGALQFCETKEEAWDAQVCLAIAYFQVGRKPDATAVLKRLIAENGDTLAYQYAEVYAQWGQKETALKWLETALRVQDPGLQDIKVDPLVDPIRDELRFKRVVEKLNFPK